MKRDIDLIKKILEAIEAKPDTHTDFLVIDGYPENEVNYNARLLVDAGYIDAEVSGYGAVYPRRLTYYGHEFLESTKDKGIWDKAKALMLKSGSGITIEILKALLVDLGKQKLGIK